MAEPREPTPIRIERAPDDDPAARAIGLDVAGVLRYQIAVLDREDRLESGTGSWRTSFAEDRAERHRTVRESVLRTFQMAVNREYFDILEALSKPGHLATADLAAKLDVGRLTIHERVSDLVSAGLATKVPEADQVAITAAGVVIVDLVREAVVVAGRDLKEVE